MSKKECEIVQDLLIGYEDGVLSNSSKQLVETHMKDCNECKKIFEDIKEENSNEEEQEKIDYLRKIKDNMVKKNIIIKITTAMLIIIILFIVVIGIKYYNRASKMEVYLEDSATYEQIEKIINAIESNCEKGEISYNLNNLNEGDTPIVNSIYVRASIKENRNLQKIIANMIGVKIVNTYIGIKT